MDKRKLFSLGLIIGLAAGVFVQAAPSADAEAKREQLRLEAQASYPAIERVLKATLEKVNLNQRLNDEQLKKAVELLETNRRNAALYEGPQKAGYMLLQSWVAYFQNDPVNAVNWSTRACKEDANNGDAWVTQTLFSLAYGKRPLEPQAARPRKPRGSRRNGEGDMPAEGVMDAPTGYGQPGTLAFDMNTLRRDLMRERMTLQEFKSMDGKSVLFRPNENMMCMLFWQVQLAAASDDPFETKPTDTTSTEMPGGMPGMMEMPTGYSGGEVSSLLEQQGYFETMSELLAEKKEVHFVEISLNAAADAEKATADRLSSVPLVFAGSPQSGASGFARIDAKTPLMMIIDKEGQIRYAGPAAGFMPAFLLTHLTGVAIDLEPLQASPTEIPPMMDMPAAPMPTPEMGPGPMMPEEMGMPGQPATEAAPAEKKYKELPIEQQVDAEKKLSYVRDLFIRGSRMRVQSYKRGVDFCREVIRDYPDTKYAEEARMLLRQVPEHRRSTYNITDEELGL